MLLRRGAPPRRSPPGRRNWQAHPTCARRVVRLRRAVPVPGGRSRVPPRPPRTAGAVRHDHRPVVAERAGRACLLLPGAEDELHQASALTDRAVAAEGPQFDSFRPYFHFAKGLAHYRRGQLDDAIATMTGDASSRRVHGAKPSSRDGHGPLPKGTARTRPVSCSRRPLLHTTGVWRTPPSTMPGSLTSSAARRRR